ncbi:MAG: rhodanese-like domain-containing protein [Cuspidothrix sp.]
MRKSEITISLIIIFPNLLSVIIYNFKVLKPLINTGIPLDPLSPVPILGDKIRTATILQIIVQKLEKLIDSKNPELLLIDVRSPVEYEYTHIPGAILVPLIHIEVGIGIKKIQALIPEHELITYCSVKFRSNKTLDLLKAE